MPAVTVILKIGMWIFSMLKLTIYLPNESSFGQVKKKKFCRLQSSNQFSLCFPSKSRSFLVYPVRQALEVIFNIFFVDNDLIVMFWCLQARVLMFNCLACF